LVLLLEIVELMRDMRMMSGDWGGCLRQCSVAFRHLYPPAVV
jgi:hypothetical protein